MHKKLPFSILFICIFTSLNAQNIPYRNLFTDTLLPRIDIFISEDSLSWLYNNVNYDGNLKANFVYFDGIQRDTVKDIGFRLRGNTSRVSAKKSFKIKFNAYAKGVKYQGIKELNLNGQHNDPTMVREKLFYDVWNAFGLPPRRVSFSKVFINNRYYGLYTSLEEFDDEWLKKAFGKGNDTGNLFKCTYPADLKYINDAQTTYKNIFSTSATGGRAYDLKTNKLADDYTDIVTLIKKANQSSTTDLTTELPQILDVDQFLKAYAVEVMLGHWDDYAYNKNNYFLYHNPKSQVFEFISYDTDNTFGVDWVNKDWGTRPIYTWHSPSNGIMVEKILKVPFYKNRFSIHVKTLMDSILTINAMNNRIDALRNFVQQAANEDTYRTKDYGFTMAQFNNNFDYTPVKQAKYGLKGFIQTIRITANNQLTVTKIAPLVSDADFVKVYPNPATNQIYIEFSQAPTQRQSIQLVNAKGTVLQKIISKEPKITLNTEGVSKGVYFVKIQTNERGISREILVNN